MQYFKNQSNKMDDSTIFQNSGSKGKQQQAYTKIKVLGEGAMGKAYLVQSNSDHQLYVMKRINIGHLNNQQKQSAMRQAHLHSIVKHPNIIAFKQIYHTTKDKLCIIMEYAQNGDLQQFLQQKNGKTLSQQVIVNYFVQICLGLKQIHSKKIIHRDIKAANIFLTKDMIVKIGDFGISKVIDQTVQATKSFVGTPYYLSPQMVEGKPYSNKADIWALGVLLYNMCCQKLPFEANSLPLLALRILRGNYPPIVGPYSKELKSLIGSMLQVDQKKRPSAIDILNKQFLQKYIPKQQLEQLQEKNRLKGTKSPMGSIASTSVLTNQNLSIKGLKKQNKEKVKVSEEEKKVHDKELKEAKKKKRDEQIKEMREDMRRKKLEFQKQKVGPGSTKNTQTYQSQKSRVSVKKTIQIDKSPQKNKLSDEANIKPSVEKPWKIPKNKAIKKQVEVEILLPTIKQRQTKKQAQADLNVDYKIQIKQYGKRPNIPSAPVQNLPTQKETNQQPINQDSGHDSQEVESSNSYNQNEQSSDNEEIGMQTDFQQMMNQLNHAQQAVQGLKNPSRHIQLYQQSSNFEQSQIASERPPQKEMNQINKITWSTIHNSDNLQQCRLILEETLGYQKFIQGYNILKDHLEYSEQKKMRGEDLDKYTFNSEVLFQKLNFFTEEEFKDCIMLLYTVIIIEQEEMKKNMFT